MNLKAKEVIYDVRWSPTHPAVLASADSEGFVDVWDINKDREAPQSRKRISDNPRPINCIRWSNDGRRIACGDAAGFLTIMHADESLRNPKPDDFDKVM